MMMMMMMIMMMMMMMTMMIMMLNPRAGVEVDGSGEFDIKICTHIATKAFFGHCIINS